MNIKTKIITPATTAQPWDIHETTMVIADGTTFISTSICEQGAITKCYVQARQYRKALQQDNKRSAK